MRIACVLVTHLRAKVEINRQPHLKERPVLVVDRDPSRARALVVDHFPAASAVTAGMTLEQALSHHGNAVALYADEPYYRRVFGRMLAALQGVSDRVEGADLGMAYVRLDGLEGLFRDEAGVVSALLNAAPSYLSPRVGVANAKFPAYVAALTCAAHGAFRIPADVSAFLAPSHHRPASRLHRPEERPAPLRPPHDGGRRVHEPTRAWLTGSVLKANGCGP